MSLKLCIWPEFLKLFQLSLIFVKNILFVFYKTACRLLLNDILDVFPRGSTVSIWKYYMWGNYNFESTNMKISQCLP